MKRREFVGTAGLATAGLMMGAGKAMAERTRPNILLIQADQMRETVWMPQDVTPNINRLRESGVSFTNHFVSAVPCSPSRACLMTGLYSIQHKMVSNCDFVEGDLQPSLDPKIPTIGSIFKKAGYRTPYRGKWHLTRQRDRNPNDGLSDYGFEGWKAPDAPFGGPPYNGALVDPIYASQAVNWISDPKNFKQPWILNASLINPHDICAYPRYYPYTKRRDIITERPPDNWTDDLETKPSAQREYQKHYAKIAGAINLNDGDAWRRYLDYYRVCLQDVDANIGKILDALERTGQYDNTIIAFTSDHGEMGGSHKLRTKGCFAYEEVMRVPLIVSWPGRIAKGAKAVTMASNVDVVPTLAALAGLTDLPYLPGVDLSKALISPDREKLREEILYYNDWEIQMKIGKSATDTAIYKSPSHVRGIRTEEWKYARYFSPGREAEEFELYNMKNDPLEMTNLANDAGYTAKRKELHDRMTELDTGYGKEFVI